MSTILIVDDDPRMRKLLRRILEKEQWDVIEAGNGNEAVAQYRESAPDVVVIDIIMPEKDGLAAIAEIRDIDQAAKVVAMSGGLVLTPCAYLDEARACGADRILPKPIERDQFIPVLRELLAA